MTFEDSKNLARFNPLNYKRELVSAFLAFFLSTWVIRTINEQGDSIPNLLSYFFDPKYLSIPLSTLKIVLLVISFLLLNFFINRIIRTSREKVEYKFNAKDWPGKWIYHGSTVVSNPTSLLVKWSRSGCLLNNYFWRNFVITFKAQFLHDVNHDPMYPVNMRHFGIIFRANDLGNYFMLEIAGAEKRIKPHIRYGGDWEILEPYEITLDLTNKFDVKLKVVNSTALLYIQDLSKPIFEWTLPTHVDINHSERHNANVLEDINKQKTPISSEVIPEITFRNKSGMIGFRAAPGQGAMVEDVKISSLDCCST